MFVKYEKDSIIIERSGAEKFQTVFFVETKGKCKKLDRITLSKI